MGESLVDFITNYLSAHGTDEEKAMQRSELEHDNNGQPPQRSDDEERSHDRDSVSQASSQAADIEMFNEREGLTLFRGEAPPLGQVPVGAVASGAGGGIGGSSQAVIETPGWKRVGRAKNHERLVKRGVNAYGSFDALDLEGLDVSACLRSACRCDVCWARYVWHLLPAVPSRRCGRSQGVSQVLLKTPAGRNEMTQQQGENGAQEYAELDAEAGGGDEDGGGEYSALEEDGKVQGLVTPPHSTRPLDMGRRAAQVETAAWKRVGRAKKDRRATLRAEAAARADEGIQGIEALMKTPAGMRELGRAQCSSPSEQLRQLSLGDAREDGRGTRRADASHAAGTESPATAPVSGLNCIEARGSEGLQGGGEGVLRTPPKVREMMSKIDVFLEKRRGHHEWRAKAER